MEGQIPLAIFNTLMLPASVTPAKAMKATTKLPPVISKLLARADGNITKFIDNIKNGELIYKNEKKGRAVRTIPLLGIDINGTRVRTADQAAELIYGAERKHSALRNTDLYHIEAGKISKEQLSQGEIFTFIGDNGERGILLQTKGTLNGKEGVYEYILSQDGKVSHQMFKPGKEVDGHFVRDK